ncbi:MAG: hypothetical protein AB8B91_04920 [Rubripirellula sp.]
MNQRHPFSDPIDPVVVAHRVVQAGMFLSLVWKWTFFSYAARVYAAIPIADDFFPTVFQSVWTVTIAFLATIASTGLSFATGSRFLQFACSVITFLGASILCVHQASYNDMTFVTVWWTSVWSMWYVWQMRETDQTDLLRKASFLSRIIVSMILLGGAAGKWTSEYWSGEVFFDIYFRDRDFWVFNLLRDNFAAASLPEMAKWYSRFVVATETISGLCLWLLPPRLAGLIGVILLASIALMSNLLLFSVLFSLIGLIAVGIFVKQEVSEDAAA